MPRDPDDSLIRDLGEHVAARDAMRTADDATQHALNMAVLDAGVAVSLTVNRSDPAAIVKAREAIAECGRLIEILRAEGERAREAAAESDRLAGRTADILASTRTVNEDIERRRRELK